MRNHLRTVLLSVLALSFLPACDRVLADGLGQSVFDQELQKLRYGSTFAGEDGSPSLMLAAAEDGSEATGDDEIRLMDLAQAEAPLAEYKSPGRAFVYSLVVPGLGQWYYGSRIKPFVFLGLEVFAVVFADKYHSQGNDLTVEYEAFNRAHWNVDEYVIGADTLLAYNAYLKLAYGSLNLDSLHEAKADTGLTHRLPSTQNQQYFEMTGKYDQFAWGWDDATLRGESLGDFIGDADMPKAIRKASIDNVPGSANRLTYEGMRDDANAEYNKSMRMVFVVMANHLVSAFEAFFTTKRHNRQARFEQEFADRIDIDAHVRSYYAFKDTPYVTVTYKF